MEAWELALASGASFLAGFLGSLVGLVLGSVRLPAVLLASGGNPAAAAGTNIAVSAAAALSGGLGHARAGRVDWRVVAWMTPPSVAAAFVGGFFGGELPADLLLAGIAAVLAWNGCDLLLELRTLRRAQRPRLAAAVAGALIGLLGGAVGLILGTLRMPALLGVVGLSAHRAVGTNLVVGFFLGIAGFVAHAARREIEWIVLAVSLLGALPGAWLGARYSGRLSERALRRAIGVALLAVATAIAAEAVT